MSTTKKYWRSVEHLQEDPEFMAKAQNEFPESIPVEEFLGKKELDATTTSRRDFLKFMGFSLTAATLAACETPVVKSIPYVIKPEQVTPGVANYYASTYSDGLDYCSIVVKAREGRPIHIEGNKLSGVTMGGVNARVNSSVLSLYDSKRFHAPVAGGQESDWDTVDAEVGAKLKAIAARGGNVRLLSHSVISPSTAMVISEFAGLFNGGQASSDVETEEEEAADMAASSEGSAFKHITYDSISNAGIINANESDFGKAAIPSYHFDKAKTIVSIGADFLSNWLSSIEYSIQYAKRRNPDADWMSRHYQFETTLSLTGSNADVRGAIKPSEHGAVAAMLYNAIAKKAGKGTIKANALADDDNNVMAKVEHAANDLWAAKGQSLVVAGSNDASVQTIVNGINDMLANYGKTIDLDTNLNIRQSTDGEVEELIKEMNAGRVDALLIHGVDPAYSMPAAWNFGEALGKVKLKVSFANRPNATSVLCDFVCPDSHYLESWDDANPKAGHYSITQPIIRPLYKTRQVQDTLLKWAGKSESYHQFIKNVWEKYGLPTQDKHSTFHAYWNHSLQDGVGEAPAMVERKEYTFGGDVNAAANKVAKITGGAWELELYVKTGIGNGNQAHNPWLQELPDPVTKVVWDNYITMNPLDMEGSYNTKLGEQQPANRAVVTVNGQTITLPVVAVPGQKRNTIGIALGYGKGMVEGKLIGENAFPMVSYNNGSLCYAAYDVTISKVEGEGAECMIASTQTHHTMMGRKIVNETDINTFKNVDANDPHHGWNPATELADSYGNKKHVRTLDLWQEHHIDKGHRWGMTIDLNTCTGCGACVTACHSENNVPVVGKDEVNRTRTMSWMRIDRYYSSDADPALGHGVEKDYDAMEVPSAYPDVVFQPVMCQHCNHAPCETVCPVAATTHSEEGLNQMAYNRCVGTRYCANNCPYKVRRFNWFNYVGDSKFTDFNPASDDLGRMVLNPDVVVRSRGVMEKCSLCVQRIQAGKLDAKKQGEKVKDGAIQTACSSACPTNAITFGDINDESTMARSKAENSRSYHLLEDVGVQPNIWYMTKVRNTEAHEEHA